MEVYDISDEDSIYDKMEGQSYDLDDSLLPIRKIINANKQNIQKRLNDIYQSKTDIGLLNFKDQLNINGEFYYTGVGNIDGRVVNPFTTKMSNHCSSNFLKLVFTIMKYPYLGPVLKFFFP